MWIVKICEVGEEGRRVDDFEVIERKQESKS